VSAISPYLIALIAALLAAHIIKYIVALLHSTAEDFWHQLFTSGGMPSSHAATTLSVTTMIALRDGISSGLFGLAAVLVLIVCYDAVKVRRSSGEQGEAIKQLIKETGSTVRIPRAAKGHTPVEVAVGVLLGVVIGYVVYIATI